MDFGVIPSEQVATLSFGARIKLSIILALARDADLLILDEPTVGLDAVSRRRLFTELLAFMRREEKTVLISSHQLADLERFADHVAIVNRGRLLAAGRIDELLERFVVIQVQGSPVSRTPAAGIRVCKQDGDRAHVLVDLSLAGREQISTLGLESISESPLTLEDLFLALVAAP